MEKKRILEEEEEEEEEEELNRHASTGPSTSSS